VLQAVVPIPELAGHHTSVAVFGGLRPSFVVPSLYDQDLICCERGTADVREWWKRYGRVIGVVGRKQVEWDEAAHDTL
jgi:hypothetical protein